MFWGDIEFTTRHRDNTSFLAGFYEIIDAEHVPVVGQAETGFPRRTASATYSSTVEKPSRIDMSLCVCRDTNCGVFESTESPQKLVGYRRLARAKSSLSVSSR